CCVGRAVTDETDDGRCALDQRTRDRLELRLLLQQPQEGFGLLTDLRQKVPAGGHDHWCRLASYRAEAAASDSLSATATWQATRRPGPRSRSSGFTVSHVAIAYGQRRRKRHPSVGLITFGG